jgi:drug/metabolite transporter (DMT)-like permease
MGAASGGGSSARFAAGLSFALVSAVSFGLSGALARGLLDTGWSAGAAVTVRIGVAACALAVPTLLVMRGRWHLLARNGWLVVAYGLVAVAGCQLCYFYAVTHLQVGVALLIEYTAPALVVAWMWARHGQRPTWLTALGALIAIAGLALVLELVSGADLGLVGVLWAFGAMVGVATYFVLSAHETEALPPLGLACGGLLVGTIGLLLAGSLGWVPMRASTATATYAAGQVPWWVPVLGLGMVTAATAYVTGIAAGRRLGSRLASFVALSEVLAAVAFAWVLLAEFPSAVQVAGGVLVVAGVVVVKLGEPGTPVGEVEAAEATGQLTEGFG